MMVVVRAYLFMLLVVWIEVFDDLVDLVDLVEVEAEVEVFDYLSHLGRVARTVLFFVLAL